MSKNPIRKEFLFRGKYPHLRQTSTVLWMIPALWWGRKIFPKGLLIKSNPNWKLLMFRNIHDQRVSGQIFLILVKNSETCSSSTIISMISFLYDTFWYSHFCNHDKKIKINFGSPIEISHCFLLIYQEKKKKYFENNFES